MATTKKNMFKQSVEDIEKTQYEPPFDNQLSLDTSAEPYNEDTEISTTKNNILDNIQKKQSQRKGTNKSIYLSNEVIEALAKTALEKGTTPSRLANDILEQVLLP